MSTPTATTGSSSQAVSSETGVCRSLARYEITGEHLTEAEYRAEQITRIELRAIEQDMAIRRAQAAAETQRRQASMIGLAFALKIQAELLRRLGG
jgi:hypothetical protein